MIYTKHDLRFRYRPSFDVLEDRNAPVGLPSSLLYNIDLDLSITSNQKQSINSADYVNCDELFTLIVCKSNCGCQSSHALSVILKSEYDLMHKSFVYDDMERDRTNELINIDSGINIYYNNANYNVYYVYGKNQSDIYAQHESYQLEFIGTGDNPPPSNTVEQVIDWNADNDNGSAFLSEYIPTTRDYQAGYTPYEDDVLPLSLVADFTEPFIGDPIELLPRRFEWKLIAQENGDGRIKFWDSASKVNQLIPSNTWQFTPGPTGPPYSTTEGRIPQVHLEGIVKSKPEKDILINFYVKTDYYNHPTTISHYQQVKATVAPVIKDMWVHTESKPYFDNKDMVPPIGNGSANGVTGDVEFRTNFVKGNAGKVGYIQFVKGSENLLINGTTGKLMTNGDKYAVTVMPQALQQQQGLGPNYGYPLLDSDAQNKPWYVSPVNLNLGNGQYQIKMTDSPGTPIGVDVQEVGYKDEYWNHVVWRQTSRDTQGNQTETIAALTRIKWTMEFKFAGYANPPGYMTTNNSPATIFVPARNAEPHFETIGENDIPRVAPSFAKVVHKFQKI